MSIATNLFFLSLLFLSFSVSHIYAAPPAALCDETPYPAFCRSSHQPPPNKPENIHEYGRQSIQKSISTTIALRNSILRHLNSKQTSKTTIFALQDCDFLLGSNLEMLSYVSQTVQNTDTLQSEDYEDLTTQLSATITNKETCLEGLIASSSESGDISPSLSNGTKLCSMSLAFFKRGWNSRKSRFLGESSARFSSRKLMQVTGAKINKTVVVNPNGSGNYRTINESITAAPNNTKAGQGYYQIRVVAGVYNEYISIPSNKKYIMIVGDGINKTIITGNHSVVDGWTTFNSATFAVVAEGFVGVNFTVRNTAGAVKHQAVALRNGADLSAFYKCSFEGYQDTLYPHSKRQFYRECDIYGTVDYIFGNAAVVFQLCNMYSRLPMSGQFNAVTAQGKTDINQNTGTSFHVCNVKAAADLAASSGTTRTYLGRPWKTYSTTVYMKSAMDGLIDPSGWSPWSGNESLSTLYYAEYSNTGPGSNTSRRVTWPGYHIITNAADVSNFTVSGLISGGSWLPSTGVPYTGGL